MGVSGSGKSTVGERLAHRLGLPFIDADDLHPAANVEKMSAGIPLTDDDRWPWLDTVGARLHEAEDGLVVACSALKRSYRSAIRRAAPDTVFVHIDAPPQLLENRMDARIGHFMPPDLLKSQLATLEPLAADEAGGTISADQEVDDEVAAAEALLQDSAGRNTGVER
jgi:carbohydrate kinase (thermoresistant glucokinase family)